MREDRRPTRVESGRMVVAPAVTAVVVMAGSGELPGDQGAERRWDTIIAVYDYGMNNMCNL